MKEKKCGQIFKEAREEKGLTINDVAFALDKEKVKLYERKIKRWEANKDFPELEELYNLSFIIDINPTQMLEYREKFRKSFTKTESDMKRPSQLSSDLSEMFYIITRVALNIFLIIVAIVFCRGFMGLVNAVMGNGDHLTEKVFVKQIDDEVNSTSNEFNNETNENMVNETNNNMTNETHNEAKNETNNVVN